MIDPFINASLFLVVEFLPEYLGFSHLVVGYSLNPREANKYNRFRPHVGALLVL